jgi:hypothetical protein
MVQGKALREISSLFSSPKNRSRACQAWFGASIHYLSGIKPGALALAGADLLASALPNIFAVIVRFTKAGTNAFMMRFIRPGTILDRFCRSALLSCSRAFGDAAVSDHARELLSGLRHRANSRNLDIRLAAGKRPLLAFVTIPQDGRVFDMFARCDETDPCF